ncbi:MAG: sugar phosphate nucleotidyltransferase [Thermoplasmata archaeon]|nr:sugar phosphate nucleotidyltransferase [Thermoplasmata archaeon]
MKAVILAAGEGTRLRPFTNSEPKPMIPIANRPILEYSIDALVKNGISDITLVVGYKKESIMSHFEDGSNWKAKIQYVDQKKRVALAGTAYALSMAKNSVKGDFLVLAGDNIISSSLIGDLLAKKGKYRIVVTESDTPSKYGVVELSGDTVRNIVEKPEHHLSNLISTGIYKLNEDIFPIIDKVMKTGKYGLTSVIQSIIPTTKVTAVRTSKVWSDVVYPWDILTMNAVALRKCASKISGKIDKGVTFKGEVSIGEGTIIRSGTHIMGPVVIGDGCEIGPSVCIYPSTSIGNNVRIGPFTVVENSVLMDDVQLSSGSYVSHSVLGEGVEINPQFCAVESEAHVRLEGEFKKVERLGVLIGEGTVIGSQVSVKSGTIIGSDCKIAHHATIDENVEDSTKVM